MQEGEVGRFGRLLRPAVRQLEQRALQAKVSHLRLVVRIVGGESLEKLVSRDYRTGVGVDDTILQLLQLVISNGAERQCAFGPDALDEFKMVEPA